MRRKSCWNAPHPALRATFPQGAKGRRTHLGSLFPDSPEGRRDGGRTPVPLEQVWRAPSSLIEALQALQRLIDPVLLHQRAEAAQPGDLVGSVV